LVLINNSTEWESGLPLIKNTNSSLSIKKYFFGIVNFVLQIKNIPNIIRIVFQKYCANVLILLRGNKSISELISKIEYNAYKVIPNLNFYPAINGSMENFSFNRLLEEVNLFVYVFKISKEKLKSTDENQLTSFFMFHKHSNY